MNDCVSIYIKIYAYIGKSICVICMYRLEYMYQCIRINPTVKYIYHVYPFVLATACAVYASKCYRMRRLCQQFASICAVYASKLLPHAPHTIAKCYCMRRIHQQFATACAAYACKNSFLHGFASVCAVCASNLLPYAPHTLATCYRMRSIRQQSASACAAYASKADHRLILPF